VLALGAVFSWISLVFDYRRFFSSGGRALELSGCTVANPVVTPCFYGAMAFLAAFAWSVIVLGSAPAAAVGRQRRLQWLLVAGTLFAWGNLAWTTYSFFRPRPAASPFTCPPVEVPVNPLLAPCFYGAIIFLAALAVSLVMLRQREMRKPPRS